MLDKYGTSKYYTKEPVMDKNVVSCNYKQFIEERKKHPMSFMLAIKCNNGIVIAADSRRTTKNENHSIHYDDSFQKTFESGNRIWGITGFYGRENECLKSINTYLKTTDEIKEDKLTEIIDSYCQKINFTNAIVNLFIGEKRKDELSLIVYDYAESLIKESAKPSRLLSFSNEAKFSAGHNEIIASLIQSLDNYGNNFEKMVEDAVKITQAAIDLDTAAKAIIPSYTQKIGGKVQIKTLKRSV